MPLGLQYDLAIAGWDVLGRPVGGNIQEHANTFDENHLLAKIVQAMEGNERADAGVVVSRWWRAESSTGARVENMTESLVTSSHV